MHRESIPGNVVLLVVDDQAARARALEQLIDDESLSVRVAVTEDEALARMGEDAANIVVANDTIAGSDGIYLLQRVRLLWPSVHRVLITSVPWPDLLVAAVNRAGVHKIICRGPDTAELQSTLYEVVNDYLSSRRKSDDFEEETTAAGISVMDEAAKPVLEEGPVLMLLTGGGPGRLYSIGEETVIGRDRQATVWIPDNDVSRHHARITRQPTGEFLLRDLGSLNGTHVNGERIEERALYVGDTIQIGNHTKLLFTIG